MRNTKKQGQAEPRRSRLGLPIPDVLIDLDSAIGLARTWGRRDHLVPIDSQGLSPALRLYWETIQERSALISEELRDRIALVDAQITQRIHELEDLERTLPPEETPSNGGGSINIRASRRREHSRKATVERIRELKKEIAALTSDRRHIHEQARDTIRQLMSAFFALAASYRVGRDEGPFWSRLFRWFGLGRRRRVDEGPAEPEVTIDFPWFASDIPFMDQFIDARADDAQVITWAYRAFLDPDSRDDSHPVGALLTGE